MPLLSLNLPHPRVGRDYYSSQSVYVSVCSVYYCSSGLADTLQFQVGYQGNREHSRNTRVELGDFLLKKFRSKSYDIFFTANQEILSWETDGHDYNLMVLLFLYDSFLNLPSSK